MQRSPPPRIFLFEKIFSVMHLHAQSTWGSVFNTLYSHEVRAKIWKRGQSVFIFSPRFWSLNLCRIKPIRVSCRDIGHASFWLFVFLVFLSFLFSAIETEKHFTNIGVVCGFLFFCKKNKNKLNIWHIYVISKDVMKKIMMDLGCLTAASFDMCSSSHV